MMSLPHTRFDMSNMAGVLQDAENAYSSRAPESTPVFLVVPIVYFILVFSVMSVLFLSCPCCSLEFVSACRFPFSWNIPMVFLYFTMFTYDMSPLFHHCNFCQIIVLIKFDLKCKYICLNSVLNFNFFYW